MNTYPAPPSKPDTSLPPISRAPAPRMSPQVVDPSAFSDVPQKSLADQLAEAKKQLRMKAKLDEVKQRFQWDTSRAWTYLRDIAKDPDFQVEVEQSPEPVGASLAQHQETIRAHVQAAMNEQLAELRREHPTLPVEDLMRLLSPDLVEYAEKIESGEAWVVRKEPIYRYTGKTLPTKIEARKPAKDNDSGLMLVMAEDGSIDHLELT